MITIEDLRLIKKHVLNHGLVSDAEIVIDEQQLPAILGKRNTNIMIMVIPSADSNSLDIDNINETTRMLFFFVSSVSALKSNHDEFLDVMSFTQNHMTIIKLEFIEAVEDCKHPLHSIFKDFKPKWKIEPEYDLHGCHGWSFGFEL